MHWLTAILLISLLLVWLTEYITLASLTPEKLSLDEILEMNADDWKGILTQKEIAVKDMNKVQLQGQMIEKDRERRLVMCTQYTMYMQTIT